MRYLPVFALAMVLTFSCCDSAGDSRTTWQCDVTLTLVPSRLGNLSSPSGEGSGTGTGETREEALTNALNGACNQLNLDAATATLCKQGDDFSVEGGGVGNIRLFSGVDRSIKCGTQ